MCSRKRIRTYGEFWRFYVAEHSCARNRQLHFIGNVFVLVFFSLGAIRSPWLFLAMPVAGYAFAWVGHFRFERNRPATFRYPLWSLLSDFKMFGLILSGRMEAEVRRHGRRPGSPITPPVE